MLERNAPNLPKRFFHAFSQCLKGFAETQTRGLDIGVREHKMIHHMRKRFTCNGHAKIFHMRKIGLGTFSWGMVLLEHDLLIRSIQRSPSGNMPSKCTV